MSSDLRPTTLRSLDAPRRIVIRTLPGGDSPVAIDSDDAPDRRQGLTLREFIAEYRTPRRPVILEDATRHWAARLWTPRSIVARAGHRIITIRTPAGPVQLTLGELTEQILQSTPEQPASYGRNIDVERELPELWADIRPRVAFAAGDWKSSRLLPPDFIFRNGLEEMFFGGAGAKFPSLHIDYWGMDGFINHLYGEKDFILYGPEQTPFLYPDATDSLVSQVNVDAPDVQRQPLFREARPLKFTLKPGDTLYLPNGWWHTTRMRMPSLSVITATWHRDNWQQFCQQYRQRGPQCGWRKGLRFGQLNAAGLLLAMRDWLAG
jgi:hypothetical protein